MRIFRWVAVVLAGAGIGLITTGILLTQRGNPLDADGLLPPNPAAIISFLIGVPIFWFGCTGLSAVLGRWPMVVAGLLTVGASFVVPWFLHAIGVIWWSYYSPIPAVAVFVAGCILIGVAAIRIAFHLASQRVATVFDKSPLRSLGVNLSLSVIGLALGFAVSYLILGSNKPPGSGAFTSLVTADFQWDSSNGVTVFYLRDHATSKGPWARVRESLIRFQIKPQLDWYMRLGLAAPFKGHAEVHVVKVVPFALPWSWGNGGLCSGKCA
jgi:hypothetical protein